MDTIKIEQR